MLIVFDDLIVDSLNNKDLISVVTELLIKGKILLFLNIYTPSYFPVTKKYQTKFDTLFHYEYSK